LLFIVNSLAYGQLATIDMPTEYSRLSKSL